jgi:ubiquinone/menaquinone biosynthesis C-methylase UbiE
MLEYETIAERIAGEQPGRVLDWGCGHGQVTDLLLRRGVEVVAFDYRDGSDSTVIPLESFPDIRAHVTGDPVRLPFADGSFDLALSCGVLEHVQFPEASLAELHRVLRPGGRLLVYKLPNRLSYLEAIARRSGMYYHGALEHDRIYTRRNATALLTQAGFRVDDFRRANMLPLTIEHQLAWRVRGPLWTLNQALSRLPVLRLLATNLELDATAI